MDPYDSPLIVPITHSILKTSSQMIEQKQDGNSNRAKPRGGKLRTVQFSLGFYF